MNLPFALFFWCCPCAHMCVLIWPPLYFHDFHLKAQIVGSKRPFSCLNSVVLGVSIDRMPDCDKEILFLPIFFTFFFFMLWFLSRTNEWILWMTLQRLVYSKHSYAFTMLLFNPLFDYEPCYTTKRLAGIGRDE